MINFSKTASFPLYYSLILPPPPLSIYNYSWVSGDSRIVKEMALMILTHLINRAIGMLGMPGLQVQSTLYSEISGCLQSGLYLLQGQNWPGWWLCMHLSSGNIDCGANRKHWQGKIRMPRFKANACACHRPYEVLYDYYNFLALWLVYLVTRTVWVSHRYILFKKINQ